MVADLHPTEINETLELYYLLIADPTFFFFSLNLNFPGDSEARRNTHRRQVVVSHQESKKTPLFPFSGAPLFPPDVFSICTARDRLALKQQAIGKHVIWDIAHIIFYLNRSLCYFYVSIVVVIVESI